MAIALGNKLARFAWAALNKERAPMRADALPARPLSRLLRQTCPADNLFHDCGRDVHYWAPPVDCAGRLLVH